MIHAVSLGKVGTIIRERIEADINQNNIRKLKAALEVVPFVELPDIEREMLIAAVRSYLEGAELQTALMAQ